MGMNLVPKALFLPWSGQSMVDLPQAAKSLFRIDRNTIEMQITLETK